MRARGISCVVIVEGERVVVLPVVLPDERPLDAPGAVEGDVQDVLGLHPVAIGQGAKVVGGGAGGLFTQVFLVHNHVHAPENRRPLADDFHKLAHVPPLAVGVLPELRKAGVVRFAGGGGLEQVAVDEVNDALGVVFTVGAFQACLELDVALFHVLEQVFRGHVVAPAQVGLLEEVPFGFSVAVVRVTAARDDHGGGVGH